MSEHAGRNGLRDLIDQLRQRKVLRVVAFYVVAAIATVEAADLIFPRLSLPDWSVNLVLGLAIAGLPLAVVLSWVYDLGPGGLERAPTPVPVGSVAAAGPEMVSTSRRSDGPRSVAVLPFANLSPETEHAYFSDGVTEDILTHLTRIEGLRVTSRTSVLRFRGTTQPVREIAHELGVESVLEGSVRVAGDRVRVVVQLIDADTDAHLWAETYDRQLVDVFAVQSEVAEQVARALEAELSTAELASINTPPTDDVRAYALYLEGMAAFETWLHEDLVRAIGCFEAALGYDPDYARAHAGLALVLSVIPAFSGRTPENYAARVTRSATRALELDPTLAQAHAAAAYAHWIERWDWLASEDALRHALELDGDDSHVLMAASYWYMSLGRMRDATSVINRALAISPGNVGLIEIMAVVEYYRASWGELPFEVSVNRLDGLIARDPDNALGHAHRGIALSMAGRDEEALESFDAALRLAPQIPLCHALRGMLYIHLGRLEEAEAEERWFEAAQAAGIADSYSRAFIPLARGDLDRHFDVLDEALRERAFLLPFIRLSARMQPLWAHPRYQRLVHQLWPGEQARVLGELGWRP